MESGKLFIGGISWDTNEDRLRQYFQNFGEILEAVIIKDRNTGRARGFGFVVFADPYVAERVVKEKHVIDGRTVEAKKAVPRDDQLNRNNGSNQGSQSPAGTKKIFVGGLASTVTDSDMKKYFDQFGNITDVVVMYDHNTKRPRGFGFITYEFEDAVDMVLLKPFHELNGKMVEVKRAVPRELSPSPVLTRSPLGFNRVTNFLTSPQGYNKSSIGDFGMRLEGRNGYVGQYNPSIDSVLSPEYAGNGMFSPNIGYGRVMNHPLSGAYTNNRYNGPVGYGGSGMDHGSDSIFNSTGRNMWANENHPSYGSYNPKPLITNDFFRSENRNTESLGAYGSIGTIWDSSSSGIGRDGGTGSYSTNNVNYDTGLEEEDNFMVNIGRSLVSNVVGSGDNYDKPFGGNVFASDSVFDDPTWQSSSTPNLVKSGNISYGLGKIASVGYVDDDYNVVSSITNRGIAA